MVAARAFALARASVVVPVAMGLVGTAVTVAAIVLSVRGRASLGIFVADLVVMASCGGFALALLYRAARQITAVRMAAVRMAAVRSEGCFGVAQFSTAVVAAYEVGCWLGGADPAAGASVALAGLVIASVGNVIGMVVLPGVGRYLVTRLRGCLDGLGVGLCLLFTVWVPTIAPNGMIGGLGFWTLLTACCALSVTVVAGLRAARTYPAAAACACGCALSTAGLAGVTLAVAGVTAGFWPLVFEVMLAVAPVVMWQGVRGAGGLRRPARTGSRAGAGLPVLTFPVAAAIVVAVFRMLTGGEFDRPSVVLGISGITAIALRETLAAVDVSRYARRMAEQEARFRSLVAGSTDVTMVLDADLIVRWQSPAALRQFGLDDSTVVGAAFTSLVHPDDMEHLAGRLMSVLRAGVGAGREQNRDIDGERPVLCEARLRDGFGQWRETESAVSDQRHVPEVAGLVVHIRDVGERKHMQRLLDRLAYADPLTGLANRRQLILTIDGLRTTSREGGALVLIELEGFTAINDVRGYDVGDAVLVEVARRLRNTSGAGDLPARLGGDEFAVVTQVTSMHAYAMASRFLTELSRPVVVAGVSVRLTASLGLASIGLTDNSEDVLRRADLALRRAKEQGRGRVEWYDEAVEQVLVRRMTLEQDLPDALARRELDLVYQPILELDRSSPYAVEALLRWRHPRLGTVLPADVIPVAEEIGVIGEIGRWVLHQSVRQLVAWLPDYREIGVAVNVSPSQLVSGDLADAVRATLHGAGVSPHRLIIEVAEGSLARAIRSAGDVAHLIGKLRELRALGVRTALDDFGTGVDSLANMRRLPVDLVKIGRTLFDEAGEGSSRAAPVVEAVVGLGRRFGVDVVATGLETPAHLDIVRQAGCRFGQGHLFARAQPAEHVEAYLDGFRGRPS